MLECKHSSVAMVSIVSGLAGLSFIFIVYLM